MKGLLGSILGVAKAMVMRYGLEPSKDKKRPVRLKLSGHGGKHAHAHRQQISHGSEDRGSDSEGVTRSNKYLTQSLWLLHGGQVHSQGETREEVHAATATALLALRITNLGHCGKVSELPF